MAGTAGSGVGSATISFACCRIWARLIEGITAKRNSDTAQHRRKAAGELRYIGKETDHEWEEGDDISVLEFKTTEYGRSKMAVASEGQPNCDSRLLPSSPTSQ